MMCREKLLAAFTKQGAPQIGVVAAYENVFLRDHRTALTDVPWWDASQPDRVATDVHARSGLEWFTVHPCPSRTRRRQVRHEVRADGVWRIDSASGETHRLSAPQPGGDDTQHASPHQGPAVVPTTRDAIDALIPQQPAFDREAFLAQGHQDAAHAIRASVDVLTYGQISSPIWALYSVVGYEPLMFMLAEDDSLAMYAAKRILANTLEQIRAIATLKADAVWIEECLTDQISPQLYQRMNLPLLRRCVEEIRLHGMKSIYYYCGDPHGRLPMILDAGADALHFEEGKKGFSINIGDMAQAIDGRCVLFGNLDVIGVLQDGSEATLAAALSEQLAAARDNGNRFIMSTGSPITPETSVERVRRYTDLTREMAASAKA